MNDLDDLDDLTLSLDADRLRSLHVPGDPLVLVNAWDVASAREVVAAGGSAIGTSSAAISASLGEQDDNTMALSLAFGAIERIAAAVPVPVTADLEAGYDLGGTELVSALLAAGAVGCNLEDTDHRRAGALVDAEVMAARLTAVRAAAREAGVDVVVNARIDALIHLGGDRPAALAEIVRRARRYVEAGADCVFPIGVSDPATAEQLVRELAVPVNVGLAAGVTVAQMAAAGASRISVGPTYQRRAMAELRQRASELLAGAGPSDGAPG
ncbi:MAG TPA: isocitrate lyase/phosphoenolpyruvate mutase family protein [Ilumatobacter sp.]